MVDRGLKYELFQALVGAALPDDDYDASLLHSLTSHLAHATTGDSNTIGQSMAESRSEGAVRRQRQCLVRPSRQRVECCEAHHLRETQGTASGESSARGVVLHGMGLGDSWTAKQANAEE